MIQIPLPYNWTPRDYQVENLHRLATGCKRIVKVWHRRGGKDLNDLNATVMETQKRVGVYWHIFPTYSQGRKAMWEAITKDGLRYLDCFPKQLIKSMDKQQTKIELTNGSIWRVVGADDIDSLVGAGPVGAVFSEYSLQRPTLWDYIQPMLLENNGWAMFNGTPRGENHFFDLVEMAKANPNWYVDIKTVDDTNVVSKEQIDELRKEGKPEEIIQQEYYCSFEGSIHGAYYSDQMKLAKQQGRICSVPYDGSVLVDTIWDLGINDAMSIWFRQTVGREVHYIDYYENTGQGLPHYAAMLREKGYYYGDHYAPHDINARELISGKTRLDSARELGINFKVVETLNVIDGINAVRGHLPRAWFDEVKCKQGINCLKQYRKEWDEKNQRFKDHPLHDWSSNGADAMRYSAVSYRDKVQGQYKNFVADMRFSL